MGRVSQAYVAGYHAGMGDVKVDNPCKEGVEAEDWQRGFADGVEDKNDIERQCAA